MNDQLMPLEVRDGVAAPAAYWCCGGEELAMIVNGCGPGGWKFDLVPDTIYGLSIRAICNVHDWMYYWGESEQDKVFADQLFLRNLRVYITKNSSWILRGLRLSRATKYFEAVEHLGSRAFWSGKEDYADRCAGRSVDIHTECVQG